MQRHVWLIWIANLFLLALTACRGTLEIGIEQTPTPDRAPAATITALANQNARLATLVAQQATPIIPPNLGRIAYVQGGDIWHKALPDGKSQRLTADGRNREPRWSPSGNWIAFRRERHVVIQREALCDVPKPNQETCREVLLLPQQQVWVIDDSGADAHPVNQGLSVDAFAWSPTRDRLAYVTANGELQIVNADGSGLAAVASASLMNRAQGRPGRIAWSPDGAWLAYEWIAQTAASSIWRVSHDGRTRGELYASGAQTKGDVVLAGWSPQGNTILFWQDHARAGFPADGALLYGIPADRRSPEPTRWSTEPMLAHPDFIAPAPPNTIFGARDALALTLGAGQGTWTNKRIELPGVVTLKNYAAISPAWSLSGTRIAYAAMPERENLGLGEPTFQELMQRRIWMTDFATVQWSRQLTNNIGWRDERPLWSADSNHILFARMDTRGRASLWILPVEGTTPRQVVDELTPAPDPIGTYGHANWDDLFDWWQGLAR
jgi:dipeptidyl aminopeptidase/acylaminoacyl peptidase